MSRFSPPPDDRVAIIGIGCRFAGGIDSPRSFWEFLLAGRTAAGPVPAGRWDAYRGRSREEATVLSRVIDRGAFIDDIAGFDAAFFGISPTEARQLDPQQRMALEVAWEALEHAGIPPTNLAGTDTGVFLGVGTDDYGRRLLEDLPGVQAWTGIGASLCAVANRISYTLDLRGASVAVDTACSSSLVALHQARLSLLRGEVPVALAGGVMLMAGPGLTTVLDRAGAISPDGRSKAFDAAADGYGRGEGCGIVVLRRLSDAQRAGDRIIAVLRGSAVHQDGRTDGIMAPSSEAQAHLMRRAYADAGISPTEVDYVEAHGTGTRVGDPIEAAALAAVVGNRAADHHPGDSDGGRIPRPCLIGSVKTNIGHTEAAAGIAGVIKTALALSRGVVPPTRTVSGPRSDIPWEASGLRLVTETTPWPASGHPRRAGVASYGYGGTIAHVVLEEAPPRAASADRAGRLGGPEGTAAPGLRLYPLSSTSQAGLAAQAARLAAALTTGIARADLAAAADTLATRRSHLSARAVVVAEDRAELSAGLAALAEGRADPAVITGTAARAGLPAGPAAHTHRTAPGAVWVFSGHGAQWSGMGRELLIDEPAFAAAIDRIDPVFAAELGVRPLEVLESGDLGSVDVIQAMLFAMQVGLSAVWRAYGLVPRAVIGHSVGEIAASVAAGALTETEGATLVCRRSRLLRRVAGRGAMVMVDRSFDEVESWLADMGADAAGAVAAISAAPASTVVSGDIPVVDRVAARAADAGWTVRRIDSDVAFHSPQMDPLCPDLAAAAAELRPRAVTVPLYVTAVGDPRSRPRLDSVYWAANLRNPVRFREAVAAAFDDGHRVFLEVSAHPVVSHSITETLAAAGAGTPADTGGVVVPSLRRNKPQRRTLLTALASLHCNGVRVNWPAAPDAPAVDLPTTAWRHTRHWVDGTAGAEFPADTLLGADLAVPDARQRMWRTTLDFRTRPYPRTHPVLGTEIVPAAVLLNTFLTAAGTEELRQVALRQPVVVPAEGEPIELRVVHDEAGLRLVTRSLAGPSAGWSTHTTALPEDGAAPQDPGEGAAGRFPGTGEAGDHLATGSQPAGEEENETLPDDHVVTRLAELGVADMGYPWTITELRRGPRSMSAVVTTEATRSWAAVLDAALSAASVIFSGPAVLRMPARIDHVRVAGPPPATARVSVWLDAEQKHTVHVTVQGSGAGAGARSGPGSGSEAALRGLRYGELDGDLDGRGGTDRFEMSWLPAPGPSAAGPSAAGPASADPLAGRTILVLGSHRVARELTPACAAHGAVVDDDPDALATSAHVVFAPPAPPAPPVTPVAPPPAADCASAFAALVQRIAALPEPRPRLWCLTQGVRDADGPRALAHAPLWGLGRVAATEHPEFWGAVVDVPTGGWDADTVVDLFATPPAEPLVAVGPAPAPGGAGPVHPAPDDAPHERPVQDDPAPRVLVPRLLPVPPGPAEAFTCRSDSTYLITGGLGVLGLVVAEHLAARGARRLVLLGRTPMPPRATWADDDPRAASIRRLEAAGVTVHTVAADVTDLAAIRAALDVARLPPVRGVVHAAGVVHGELLRRLDDTRLREVLAPKVDGAWVLHQLFPPGSTDFFVLFSSAGPLLGLPGQGAYAAANTFLDVLAAHRRTAGHCESVSIAWTSWQGLGMATSGDTTDMELAARGTTPISPDEALRAFDQTAAAAASAARAGAPGSPLVAVLGLARGHTGPRPALLSELATTDAAAPADVPDWIGLRGNELADHLLGVVGGRVAAVLGTGVTGLDPNQPLTEAGVDSLLAASVRIALEREFGIALPATLLWNHPTVVAIAGHLASILGDAGDPALPHLVGRG
ncbi:Beta-ketoacyl synthase [Parafrankia sp. EAN1pec]|uniref:type I polyketide synthase n=1 Tax=Parafrankia sp. (strain EAN1pec) TaxID=298653 RepID=UPI00015D9E98|nr:Beta-ketoacyl synthase [Frankia sp. EAN1pec]